MKLIMTLLVRDEEDILKENIDFHLSQGVDFIIATDNCSVDGTKEILKNYEDKGVLKYFYQQEDTYNQHQWVTEMARYAKKQYDADWVINNDADEFWFPKSHTTLKAAFESIKQHNIVEAQRYNYVPLHNITNKFYETMIYREIKSYNPLGMPLPPKQAHRALSDIVVNQGNHSVDGFSEQLILQDLIEILHFPIRTPQQLLNKIKKGGAAYENNSQLPKSIGVTWRKLYEQLQNDGNLDRYLHSQLYDNVKITKALRNNLLVEDTRLKECLNFIYKK